MGIGDKDRRCLSFGVFDIKVFYPAITPELLEKAMRWGGGIIVKSEQDKELFREARRSVLHHS